MRAWPRGGRLQTDPHENAQQWRMLPVVAVLPPPSQSSSPAALICTRSVLLWVPQVWTRSTSRALKYSCATSRRPWQRRVPCCSTPRAAQTTMAAPSCSTHGGPATARIARSRSTSQLAPQLQARRDLAVVYSPHWQPMHRPRCPSIATPRSACTSSPSSWRTTWGAKIGWT